MSAPVAASKREATKAANRAAILAAASEVFADLGYEAASIRDVIRRTELAAGTFYNYFPDKESVFRALVSERVRPLRARLREARAGASSLEEFVRRGYRAYFGFIASDPDLFSLLRRNAGTIRSVMDAPVLDAGVEELLEDLRGATARGDLPPGVDADYLAGAMTGVGLEVAVRMVERRPMDVDGATAFATGLFLGGIARLGGGG
ncbi:MAG TPA: TetR/AcrR family transcriptional regulator [Solirubrobacteraceae bacterium]|nr:TetR/AcrR family transcriptional regulator [Solirubrobacteraceae bacterium]